MSKEVCVFGENRHDSDAIGVFVRSVCNGVTPITMSTPVSLQRGVQPVALRKWVENLSGAIEARKAIKGDAVVGALVHRDSDASDKHGRQAAELDRTFAGLPVPTHAVVAVQAIEAWWLSYPEAAGKVRRTWKGRIPVSARDPEAVGSPKDELRRCTRRKAGDSRGEYAEKDSLEFARAIVSLQNWADRAPNSLRRAVEVMRQL